MYGLTREMKGKGKVEKLHRLAWEIDKTLDKTLDRTLVPGCMCNLCGPLFVLHGHPCNVDLHVMLHNTKLQLFS